MRVSQDSGLSIAIKFNGKNTYEDSLVLTELACLSYIRFEESDAMLNQLLTKLRERGLDVPKNSEGCLKKTIQMTNRAQLGIDSSSEDSDSSSDLENTRLLRIRGKNISMLEYPKHDTECLIIRQEENIVVTFRGTESLRDALRDANAYTSKSKLDNLAACGKFHSGFIAAYDAVAFYLRKEIDNLQDAVRKEGQVPKIWFTGHSLGAALATIAAFDQEKRRPGSVAEIHTIGSPRCGNKHVRTMYESFLALQTMRFVNKADLITKVPTAGIVCNYRHVGQKKLLSGKWGHSSDNYKVNLWLAVLRGATLVRKKAVQLDSGRRVVPILPLKPALYGGPALFPTRPTLVRDERVVANVGRQLLNAAFN